MRLLKCLPFKARLLAVLLVPSLLFIGCACLQAQHADEPACRDITQAIDCTEQNIASKATQFVPLVGLISGSSLDQGEKDQMLSTLVSAGVGAVACAVKALSLAAAPVAAVAPGQAAGPERLRAHIHAKRAKDYADHYIEKNHVRFQHDPPPAAVDFSTTVGGEQGG